MNREKDPTNRIREKDVLKEVAGSTVAQRVRRALGKARRLRLLPYVLLFAPVAALPLLSGCVAHVRSHFPYVVRAPRYSHRPHPQYFCYDCHGYTYFSPYYDYCTRYSFRIRWGRYSSLRSYHERYSPRTRRGMYHFSDYKYKPDYRKGAQYKKPVDYKKWKKTKDRTFYSGKKKTSEGQKKSGGSKQKSTKSKTTKSQSGRSKSGKT